MKPDAKCEYTEAEAAEQLGVPVTELREMVRTHILDNPKRPRSLAATSFQRSDVVILRLLSGGLSNSFQTYSNKPPR